jgi:hypothetical protein
MFELIQLVVFCAVGLLCLIFGLLIWKKKRITLIHSYHYTKVAEENKAAYTEKMGKALIVMSIGMFIAGIVNYSTSTAYGWIGFVIFFATGLTLMCVAQKKYNGEVF